MELTEQELAIRRRTVKLITQRSAHGGVLVLEVNKAELALSAAKLKHAQQTLELLNAKRRLAALWEGSESDLQLAKEEPVIHEPEQELDEFDVRQSPQYLWERAEVDRKRSELSVAKSLSVPDVTVSAGYRHLEGTSGDNALVAGLSVPLTIFDRNQFGIPSAEQRVTAKAASLDATRVRLHTEIQYLQSRLRFSLSETEMLKTRIVPQSKQVLSAATKAYRLGQTSYLEYLDAQTTYLGHKERLIEVVIQAIQDQIAIQTIKGTVVERIHNDKRRACNDK
jgi:cobalt-zinc-cadmium efflux system outer membrane protein